MCSDLDADYGRKNFIEKVTKALGMVESAKGRS
jgi:hypothetical protein